MPTTMDGVSITPNYASARNTNHKHTLLHASIDATPIHTILRDSSSCDIGSDQVDRRVDCGVSKVIFRRAHAGSEVGENQLVDIKF
jgi:hypothetical protein